MKTFRLVFGILAIIPLALLLDALLRAALYGEDSLGAWVFPLVGVLILILNYWAWFEPEIIEFYLFGTTARKSQ